MLKIRVFSVGRLRDPAMRSLLDDYAKRIGRYARFEEVELRDEAEGKLSPRLEKAFADNARVVALEVEGKPLSSQGLADLLGDAQHHATRPLSFLIGGSYGLPSEISKRAHTKLSLSKMILPHRLARLFLYEQVYRGFTILKGEPYSH